MKNLFNTWLLALVVSVLGSGPAVAQTCTSTAPCAASYDTVIPSVLVASFYTAPGPGFIMSLTVTNPGQPLQVQVQSLPVSAGQVTRFTGFSTRTVVNIYIAAGVTPEFFFSRLRVLNEAASAASGQPVATPCPLCPVCGPGPKLVNWTQADVDAVRAANEATAATSAATLAAITALNATITAQSATLTSTSATAGYSFDWGVAGALAASVLAGFVTAARVV